ncbi:MAG: calcium-binding protein, partial [Gammaproteobacteria bacterium]|nr:calcium-binding protein [Gammaproteobacteria bacterium]
GFWGDGANGAPLEGDLVLGDEGNDTLQCGPLGDLLIGSKGDDIIDGGGGDDRIFGGDGADQIFGQSGADLIFGGTSFNDLGDTIDGGSGEDLIYGYLGDDHLNGGLDADTLLGGVGNDLLNGGAANDTASYANASGGVTVYLKYTGRDVGGGQGVDTLVSKAAKAIRSHWGIENRNHYVRDVYEFR